MAKTNTTGDGAGDRKELRTTELTEEQLRIEKIRKMTEEADNKRRLSDSEILFPAEPLPALVYADNPKARYDLWYGSIMRFKRLYLKGDGYLEVRREINKFMKEGRETGMDSRMASQVLMTEAADACRKWLGENGGQNTMELYLSFVELNKRWDTVKAEDR